MDRVSEDLSILKPSYETLRTRFNNTVRKATLVLFVERAWPRAVPALCTGGLFTSASCFGLWHALPPGGRMAGVAAFALALAVAPIIPKAKSLFVNR